MKSIRLLTILAVLLLTTFLAHEDNAHARFGGGGSMGSRGSRSYASPMSSPSRMSPTTPYGPMGGANPSMGSFGRGMLGGFAGGMLGGMLSRSLGFGGGGGGGLLDILLFAGIGYLIYRFVQRRREDGGGYPSRSNVIPLSDYQNQNQGFSPGRDELGEGLSQVRRTDPSFDEQRFNDLVMDNFFKVQGAWMNRDLSSVGALLTEEIRGIVQKDIDALIKEKKVNRLENIAVRTVEISEAWQENGQDFLTARIYANLLDYTTDDVTGAVLSGSKSEPVKFEEYWTFTRPMGNNRWKLSAINQQ